MNTLGNFKFDLIALLQEAPPQSILDEGDLERRYLLPRVSQLLEKYPRVHAYAHPWGRTRTCAPNCVEGRGLLEDYDGLSGVLAQE